MKNKKNIWIEKIGLLDLIKFLVQGIFSKIIVHYDENNKSKIVNRFISFLIKKKIGNFCPANLSFNIRNSEGYSKTYDTNEFFNSCFIRYQEQYFSDITEWFSKLLKCYLSEYLFNKVVFVEMVESKIASFDLDTHHEIYLRPHLAISIITRCYKEKGLNIKQSSDLISYLNPIFGVFKELFKIVFNQLSLKKIKNNISNLRPSVWIEYYRSEVTSRRLNVWLDYLKPENFDLVYFFDRPDSPVTEESKDFCKEKCIRWVDLLPLQAVRWCFGDYVELFKKLLKYDKKNPLWFHFFKIRYFILFKIYYSIFNYFQVKVLFQHREVSWIQGVQTKALEAVGGIMAGFQWSSFVYSLENAFLIPQHVYFVWGKTNFDFVKNKGLTSRYVLPSGEPIISEKPSSDLFKAFSSRFEFTFTIFDSSASYNLYQDPHTLSEFYLALIALLEKKAKWGGIIKSKGWDLDSLSNLPNGKMLSSRMSALIGQGRLLLHDSLAWPLDVAVSTDLTVSYGINSAGIIAGIGGCRSIHWDCSGLLHYPIYEDTDQEIIFLSLRELEKAVLKVAAGNQSIGDFSPWRQKFNHFDDFVGAQRISSFVQSFMEVVVQTNNTEQSLIFAVEKYSKDNKTENWLLENLGNNCRF